jgi:3D (Asp-Asp-Asp) domain-containing protein
MAAELLKKLMDIIRLFSCGLLALTGWSAILPQLEQPVRIVTFSRFFAPLHIIRRAVARPLKLRKQAPIYTVTATAYEAVAGQTDAEPFVTADNSRIPKKYSSRTRWLALSRDLLRPWGGPFAFGDTVRVRGISPGLDGVYTVHDTMARRHRRRLDVLVHPREHIDLFKAGTKIQLAAL